jgi:hypothetical protein
MGKVQKLQVSGLPALCCARRTEDETKYGVLLRLRRIGGPIRRIVQLSLLLQHTACLHPCQLHLLHNHRMPMQRQLYNLVGSIKPRLASSAWLRVLVLALLCLLLSPVRSCLLQAGRVWGERCRRSEGGHPLCSSL